MDDNKKPLSEFENMIGEDGFVNLDDIEIVEDNKVELPKKNEEVKEASGNPLEDMGVQAKEDIAAAIESEKPVENPTYIQNVTEEVKEEKVIAPEPTTLNASAGDDLTIGTIKPDTQKSPFAMIILFGALALFIVFMQPLLELSNEVFHTNFDTFSGANVDEGTKQDEEVEQEVKMYQLATNSVITVDNIEVTNFKLSRDNGYKLSFSIKNKGTQLYSFSSKVFFDYFDDTNTFVGRSYLENVKEITGGITNEYSVVATEDIYSKATKLEMVLRTEDTYPTVELTNNKLTCSDDDESIVYGFENNKLISIRDMFTYEKGSNPEIYSEDLLNYKSKMESLSRLDGITAVLTENETGFITSILIDYSNADYKQISSNKNYYIKDTYARVINFEMNAKGYTCR